MFTVFARKSQMAIIAYHKLFFHHQGVFAILIIGWPDAGALITAGQVQLDGISVRECARSSGRAARSSALAGLQQGSADPAAAVFGQDADGSDPGHAFGRAHIAGDKTDHLAIADRPSSAPRWAA